jgi:hypothetical protein
MFAYTYRDVELTDGRDMVDYFKRPGGPANDRKPVKPKFQWSYPYAR